MDRMKLEGESDTEETVSVQEDLNRLCWWQNPESVVVDDVDSSFATLSSVAIVCPTHSGSKTGTLATSSLPFSGSPFLAWW